MTVAEKVTGTAKILGICIHALKFVMKNARFQLVFSPHGLQTANRTCAKGQLRLTSLWQVNHIPDPAQCLPDLFALRGERAHLLKGDGVGLVVRACKVFLGTNG